MERGQLQEVLASFPSGVAVVTAFEPSGYPVGLTVSAFCSVSAEPPLVLVCVDQGSQTRPAIERSGAFTVNLLAAGRDWIAKLFATKNSDKFAELDWIVPEAAGGPVLHHDTIAHLVCEVHLQISAGDHQVVVGRVISEAVSSDMGALLYHRRQFVEMR